MIKIEIKSVSGSILYTGEHESVAQALECAVSSGADLSRADLTGADLTGADLSRAFLGEVHTVAQLGHPDSWPAWTWLHADGLVRICVGCHEFTLAQARKYWTGEENRREVLAAVEYAAQIAAIRGWTK